MVVSGPRYVTAVLNMSFGSSDDTTSKLNIGVGLMQKETVSSSKLRILRLFEVRVKKFRKNHVL